MGILKERKSRKNLFIIIGSLFIFSGITIILYPLINNKYIDIKEEKAIKEYYIEEVNITEELHESEIEEVKPKKEIKYIGILKIPIINLERGLVDRNSYSNNVNYNIQILSNSSMPDEKNGNVILAAHSGNGRTAFFKNLDKLTINDEVIIDYKNKTYKYKIIDIYDIEKTGKAKIIRNNNVNTLTLVTCRHNTNNQIIVICELKEVM